MHGVPPRGVGNERQWRGAYASAVSVRLPQFWHSAARYLFAFALRCRRPGTISVFVGRPPPRQCAGVVAGIAAWAHRLWKFAIPITIFLRGQWPAHQPRLPHLGRTAKGE